MTDCIFCKILAKEIPCSQIYEDENTFAFLDINPVNKGHALVILKKHYETLLDIPKDELCTMIAITQKVSKAIFKSLNADALNVMMNSYPVSGQLVPHAHFHIIPRFSGDGFKHWKGAEPYKEGEMDSVAGKIKEAISE